MKTINTITKAALVAVTLLFATGATRSEARANDSFTCATERVTDAAKCGTSYVVDGAKCGWDYVTSATACGTKWVTSTAQCGTQYVVNGAQCGWQTVTSAAQCGQDYVTSGAQCGWQTVTSGAQCGWKTVTSAAQCGWNYLSSLFGLFKKPATCQVARTCDKPKSCWKPKTCSVARGCDVPKTCEVPESCNLPRGCDWPNTCDVQECVQEQPGEDCIPGVAPCDIEGFSCDPLEMRCLPNYEQDLDVADYATCLALYDDKLEVAADVAGTAMTYGVGFSVTAGASGSLEVGTVYGEAGQYGCYRTICAGVTTDLSIAGYAAFGMYNSWSVVGGDSYVTAAGASIPEIEIGFTTTQVWDTSWNLIGTTDSLSIGVGLLPAQVGLSGCNTVVYQVY